MPLAVRNSSAALDVGCQILDQGGRPGGKSGVGRRHPSSTFLAEAAVEKLIAAGVALVGIDSVNIDDTNGGERPAHTRLLAEGVPVVEHLTALQGTG